MSIKTIAATLPANPTDDEIQALASALATHAAPSKHPRKSIELNLRHHCSHIAPERRTRAKMVARECLEREGTELASAAPIIRVGWVPLSDAAEILQLPQSFIRNLLRWPQWRRTWGWPRCYNGRDWFFLVDAITGLAWATTVNHMPAEEPAHALPTWCLRVSEVDMNTMPTGGSAPGRR